MKPLNIYQINRIYKNIFILDWKIAIIENEVMLLDPLYNYKRAYLIDEEEWQCKSMSALGRSITCR